MTANQIAVYPSTSGLPPATAAGQVPVSTGAGTTYVAGPAGAMTLISAQSLASAATSVTFTSIPGTYTNLKLLITTTSTAGSVNLNLTFNSDTGTNYTYGLQLNSNSGSTAPFLNYSSGNTSFNLAPLNETAPNSTSVEATIFNYAGTVFTKNVVDVATPSSASGGYIAQGFWNSTAAITSITLTASSGNLVAGSIFSLYGIS